MLGLEQEVAEASSAVPFAEVKAQAAVAGMEAPRTRSHLKGSQRKLGESQAAAALKAAVRVTRKLVIQKSNISVLR